MTILILLLLLLTTFINPTRAFAASRSHHHFTHRHQHPSSRPTCLLASQQHSYLATCLPGLSDVVSKEIKENIPGAYNVQTSGASAVTFQGDSVEVGLSALLWTRATLKLLEWIACSSDGNNEHTPITTRDDVYNFIQSSVDSKLVLGNGQGGLLTLSVHVVLVNARDVPRDISHSHYTALTIKNALVDAVRDLREDGERPSVDIESADVPLVAFVKGAGAQTSISLYRQLHHGSLHKRGYRSNTSIHKASMKESMAAGLLLATNYDFFPNETFTIVDPMAGSGSLILEACMILGNVAPGIMRIKCGVPGSKDPPVLKWKSHDKEEDVNAIWNQLLLDATSRAKKGLSKLSKGNVEIVANEIHPGALDLLEDSLYKAGFSNLVQVHQGDCQDFILSNSNSNSKDGKVLVVTNPPWGVRLSEDMHESWEALRVFLRENCPPGRTTAFILSGNKGATKHLGLRKSQSLSLKTGQQDLRWIQYEILDKRQEPEERASGDNVKIVVEKSMLKGDAAASPRPTQPESSDRQSQDKDDATRQEEAPNPPRRYIPRQQKPKSRVSYSSTSRGGYERGKSRNDGSITQPLSDKERQERKNSWYI